MPHQDNPAGRLYLLLERARRGKNEAMKAVWVQTLGLDDSSTSSLLLSRMAKVVSLPTAIRSEVEHLDGVVNNPDAFTTRLPEVERALEGFFSSNRDQFRKVVTDAVMVELNLLSELLSTHRPEPVLQDQQLQAIVDDLEGLERDVEDSPIDPDLKESLLFHIESMKNSVAEVDLTGVSGISSAAESTVGAIVSSASTRPSLLQQSAVKKLLAYMWRLVVVLSVVSGAVSLPQNVSTAVDWVSELQLPSPPPGNIEDDRVGPELVGQVDEEVDWDSVEHPE